MSTQHVTSMIDKHTKKITPGSRCGATSSVTEQDLLWHRTETLVLSFDRWPTKDPPPSKSTKQMPLRPKSESQIPTKNGLVAKLGHQRIAFAV